MRDDLIQGIVFSRSEVVNLRRLSRRERMVFKMLATKKSIRQITTSAHPTKSLALQSQHRDFVAIRGDENRQHDLKQLQDRLKSV